MDLSMAHPIRNTLIALLLTAGLVSSACTPSGGAPETPVEIFEADPFVEFEHFALTLPTNTSSPMPNGLDALQAALPDYAELSWADVTHDAASGATVFTDLSIGLNFGEPFGLKFETARFWGLETELLIARLSGDKLAETGTLFTRLDAKAISYYGVSVAMNQVFGAFLDGYDMAIPDTEADFMPSVNSFVYTIDSLVIENFRLQPWELRLWPEDDFAALARDDRQIALDSVHLGQHILAVARTFSYDTAFVKEAIGHIDYSEPFSQNRISFSVEKTGLKGANGWDLESYIVAGVETTQTSKFSAPEAEDMLSLDSPFPDGLNFSQGSNYSFAESRDIKLNRLAGFLARGELPSMSERDLISLGTHEATNFSTQLNDQTIFTAERLGFSLDTFDWIIPGDVRIELDGAAFGTESLARAGLFFFEQVLHSAGDEPADAEAQQFYDSLNTAIDLMSEYQLSEIPFDAAVVATWNSDKGPADFSYSFASKGFGEAETSLGLTFPNYTALQAAYESENREAAFEAAFEAALSFREARYYERDSGGYDKILNLAHTLGKAHSDQGWGAVLAGMEPLQMRTYLATLIRMGKASAEAEFAPAADWLDAIATYVETGGAIELRVDPPEPITIALMESYDDPPEPDEMVNLFGISVSHLK